MIGRLTERARVLRIFAAAAVLILLAIYAARVGPRAHPSYDEARRDPASFADREISFAGDIEKTTAAGFIFQTWDSIPVTARGELAAGQEGFRVAGRAIFRADGTLDVLASHVYRYRVAKNLMAILPVIVVAWAFFRRYAFDVRRFVFRERPRGENRRA